MKSALVAIGLVAALVASGSATVEQASNAGMKGLVPFALVVLLEVVNVAGTWVWMSDDRPHVQWEAAAGVGVASLVTGACGVLSYGPIGLVAAVGVLFTVHLVGRLRHRPTVAESTAPDPVAVSDEVEQEPAAAVPPPALELTAPSGWPAELPADGTALERAERYVTWCLNQGATVPAVGEINRAVGTSNYIRGAHISEWRDAWHAGL